MLSAVGFTTAFGDRPRDHPLDPRRRRPVSQRQRRRDPHPPQHLRHLRPAGRRLLWTYRRGIGDPAERRWESRVAPTLYGVASALTLDEFALWLDLHDDYWDKQGRKSIDAVAIFGGLLTIGVAGRSALREIGLLPKWVERTL